MRHSNEEFILPAQLGNKETLQGLLNATFDSYTTLLNTTDSTNNKIELFEKLHEQEQKFEVAFKAVKETNKADNPVAIEVLQKLAVKLQQCQMLTQAIKAHYDIKVCETSYKKALINLGGCLKKDPTNLGDAPLIVAGTRMELELAHINLLVTTKAVNALNQSNTDREPISTIDLSKANDSLINKVTDDINIILTEAHNDTAHKIKVLINTAQNKGDKELLEKLKETRQSLFISSATENPTGFLKSKGESATARIKTLINEIENKTTNDSSFHTIFCSLQKISQHITSRMRDIPHYVINDADVYQEGVLVKDTATRKGTKSESLLSIFEGKFPKLIENAIDASKISTNRNISNLLKKVNIDSVQGTQISIERVNAVIGIVDTEIENINNELKTPDLPEKRKEELKSNKNNYNKFIDSLNELKMNLNQVYDAKSDIIELKEIISKHKVDKQGSIAGVLDLDSRWTIHTLSKNEDILKNFKKMGLKEIDEQVSKEKNEPMLDYIEKKFSNEIKQELLPAAKNADKQKKTREYNDAWNQGPKNATNKDMVEKFSRRALNKLGIIGEKAGLRIDMPNVDAFENISMNRPFVPMVNDFAKQNASELVNGKLPIELKHELSQLITNNFSDVMKAANLTQFQDAHVEAIFSEIEEKIARSQLSGNSILPFVSGDFMGADSSICNKVVMQQREIERASTMEELKKYNLDDIINNELKAEDLNIKDPRITSMIREKGPDILKKTIDIKFNSNQHTADLFSYNLEQAWNKKGLEEANQAADIIEKNFDMNTVSPEVKRNVIYRHTEKILKEGGLVDSLPADEPAVNRICYLLNNEIAASAQQAVKQTTRQLNDIHQVRKDPQLDTNNTDSPKTSAPNNSPFYSRINALKGRERSSSNPPTPEENIEKKSLRVNVTRPRSSSSASTIAKSDVTTESKEMNSPSVKKAHALPGWASPFSSRKQNEKTQSPATEPTSPKMK